ncbi:MAG: Type II secretory pathway, pullulanase PulA and related glycosidase, partial [Eubacteriales bacterium]|nr:Type II secretory pathway, pullulanase PulA and related glycosidase [Eubacteriales bacterium]
MTADNLKISAGNPLIPGVTKVERGYNFTIEADEDAKVALVLYQKKTREPVREIPLKHELRMGRVRSVRVEGISPAVYEYNYRINGEIYHDPRAMLVYGREVFGAPASKEEDEHAIRSGMFYPEAYDWEEDKPLNIPYEDLILYKVHVRGYTMGYKGRISKKGTFSALKKMIPYWKELGINGIELMPAYEFAETFPKRANEGMVTAKQDTERVNFWGYRSGFYFAPKKSYCAEKKPENEVRDFVKALHKAGMECIMEFYFPEGTDASYALKALQWWKVVYHIDGFHIVGEGAPLDLILRDGLLSETKLMAAGYDFGRLPRRAKRTLAEYQNGFQQDMRRILKSDEDMVGTAVRHIRENSADHGTINYMASQDGFTLKDLVT